MDCDSYDGLGNVLAWQAARRPEAVAIVFEGRPLTYAELDHRSTQVAAQMKAAGIAPGAHVGILARNSERVIEVLFGIVRAGGIATPLNWRLAPAEIAWIVEDARMSLIFTDTPSAPLLSGCDVETILLDRTGDDDSYERWLAAASDMAPAPPTDDEHVVLQIYTSGTTGRPKGAMLCNRNFDKYAGIETDRFPAWFQSRPDDTSLIALPLFHIGGIEATVRVLFGGSRMILHREFDPGEVLESIATYRPTIVSLVPTALHMVLNHPAAADTDFSCIRTLLYGASPITLGLLRQAIAAMPAQFCQVYGMTETCSSITALPPEVHHPDGTPQMRAAGKALPGIELAIAGADGAHAQPGEVGEVLVRGRAVMAGYWNNPEATAATIDRDGWLHSGDAGFMDADGYVYIHDRVKDMIISGGENIYPTEVENAIFGHPCVAEVAVIGVPDDKWGEVVLGVITLRPGTTFDEAEVIAHTRAQIASYKTPRRIVVLDELPKNATGKLLKTELRRIFATS